MIIFLPLSLISAAVAFKKAANPRFCSSSSLSSSPSQIYTSSHPTWKYSPSPKSPQSSARADLKSSLTSGIETFHVHPPGSKYSSYSGALSIRTFLPALKRDCAAWPRWLNIGINSIPKAFPSSMTSRRSSPEYPTDQPSSFINLNLYMPQNSSITCEYFKSPQSLTAFCRNKSGVSGNTQR